MHIAHTLGTVSVKYVDSELSSLSWELNVMLNMRSHYDVRFQA